MDMDSIIARVKSFFHRPSISKGYLTRSRDIPDFDSDYAEEDIDDLDQVTYYDTENSRLSRGKNKSAAKGIDSFG